MLTDGILNIDKPANMTSHDVVAIVRRTIGIKRVGHTGTLDPMATGVLPVCIGKATRIMEYLDMDFKKYRCTMAFGITTDTFDIWGEVLSRESTDFLTKEMIEAAAKPFLGVVEQTPPIYSALKVNGKKLYEYARAGEEVEIKTRRIFIKDFTIEDIDLNGENKTMTFVVECTKGTYIRSICGDIGKALGCGGTMTQLRRISSGAFNIDSAIDINVLKEMEKEDIEKLLLPADYPLDKFGAVKTDNINGIKFINGWHLSLKDCEIIEEPLYKDKEFPLPIREEFKRAYRVYAPIEDKNVFLGVAFYNNDYKKLVADKVFYSR